MDVCCGHALDDVKSKWINHGSQIRETRTLQTAVCEMERVSEMGSIASITILDLHCPPCCLDVPI
jgi:hypothetical protein